MLVTLPPVNEVETSKWNTRGWAYQEGLLARRRLVFTESQVYFQCTAMHYHESLSVPLATFHIKDLSRFHDEFASIFPRYGIGKRAEKINNRISEYAHR